MPRAAVKPEKTERRVVCPPGRMKLMGHAHNTWSLHAPTDSIPEDVGKSDFWELIADKLRPFDKFEVLAEDGSWLVEGLVQSCSRNWAQVFIKNTYKLGESAVPDKSQRYRVEWNGPENLWCVIRNTDGAILESKLENALTANKWLAEFEAKTL